MPGKSITLDLPDDLYEQVYQVAAQSQRPVERIVLESLRVMVKPGRGLSIYDQASAIHFRLVVGTCASASYKGMSAHNQNELVRFVKWVFRTLMR
jgi:hypothetical protein